MSNNNQTLRLTLLDEDSRTPVPARVEVVDTDGRSYIAKDALPTGGDWVPHDEAAWLSLEESLAVLGKEVENPFSGTKQFYSSGQSILELPVGDYIVRAFKGLEYEIG